MNHHFLAAGVTVTAVAAGTSNSHSDQYASTAVDEVAFGLEVVGTGYIYIERVMKRREQLLFHNGDDRFVSVDLVRAAPRQNFLLDERKLISLEILEGKLITDAERLAVDEVDVLVVRIANVEVVAPGKQLLFQSVSQD